MTGKALTADQIARGAWIDEFGFVHYRDAPRAPIVLGPPADGSQEAYEQRRSHSTHPDRASDQH